VDAAPGLPEPLLLSGPVADEPALPIQFSDPDPADPPEPISAVTTRQGDQAASSIPPSLAAGPQLPDIPLPIRESPSAIHQRMVRPPVAVDAPPIAITRSADRFAEATFNAPVQPADRPELSASAIPAETLAVVGPVDTPTLFMTRAQVRSLTIGGQLHRVAVADKNVCQAFATGPNQLKLIGTGNGVTRLVVWTHAADASPARMQSFEVHVDDAITPNGKSTSDKSRMLSETIRRAFPGSRVQVQSISEGLVVVGYCDSEDDAKKIMRMVRKTCLIPVRDEIKVR
jgi:Flp pilus assembly secretin CpaC